MLADLRLALRTLHARPGFTLAVVLGVALGIAVDTTVYSMANPVVLRPLPYAEPERLVAVQQVDAAAGTAGEELSLPDLADLRDGNRTFATLAAFDVRLVDVALGARGADACRTILGRSPRLVGASLGVGLLLAFGVTRLPASLLYGVSPGDTGVLAGVTAALGAVALLASYLPARRAAHVDPVIALRAD
ncbi:MAG TPA: hypothetical protein VFS08_15105 [Gemmatimonadaceae bacterium]|nr:hypothetical protein [Gemmatimonadaceae bacterium]